MPSPDLLRERLIAALAAEIGPSLYARSTQQLASALADVAIAEFTSALDARDAALAEARADRRLGLDSGGARQIRAMRDPGA